jgi:thymidylate synthase
MESIEKQHDEQQYLNLLRSILKTDVLYGNRTGVRTKKLIGQTMRFDLNNDILPLLTTKKMGWKTIMKELLWFISGSTNELVLQKQKVNIWTENGSRENLDELGFKHRQEGDLGPVYGFQWRHFGAKYVDCNTDYTGQGVDQLKNVINTIKTNPFDRRLIITAHNPTDTKEMVLPPCHMFMQFIVTEDSILNTIMYQRSCDMGLGIPFNIASYAMFTHMIAHVCNLKSGEFIHMMGDVHIYENHFEPLQEQITRTPYKFPKFVIKRKVVDIDDFKLEDFDVVEYESHPAIKMEMAL